MNTQEQQHPTQSFRELTEHDVKRMVSLRASGMRPDKIAAMFAIEPEDYPEIVSYPRINDGGLRLTRTLAGNEDAKETVKPCHYKIMKSTGA